MSALDKKSHRKVCTIGGIAAALMFGFCFAMVPLYSVICKATGINTSVPDSSLLTAVSAEAGKSAIDLTRTIKVEFVAVNNKGMPWQFFPRVHSINIHPGQNNKVYFYAKNETFKTMTVQAIPSMTPTDAIQYFHKIECFCFKQQTLKGKEGRDMPLIFRVDKEIPKEINVITLAYTLFDVVKPNAK